MHDHSNMVRATRAAAQEIIRRLEGAPGALRIHYKGAG